MTFMNRGDIWLINLEPTIGSEIKKTRPAIIVNDDAIGILPLKIIVPITTWKEQYTIASWMIRINPDQSNGLDKPSAADTFQVRSISQERFIKQLGKIPDSTMQKITEGLALVLSIEI